MSGWVLTDTLFANPWNFRSISAAFLIESESQSDSRAPYFCTTINVLELTNIIYSLNDYFDFKSNRSIRFWYFQQSNGDLVKSDTARQQIDNPDRRQTISNGRQRILRNCLTQFFSQSYS